MTNPDHDPTTNSPAAVPVAAPATWAPAEPAAGTAAARRDVVRLAALDPARPTTPPAITRLRSSPGRPDLEPALEEDAFNSLVTPGGPEGEAEDQLALGEMDGARRVATELRSGQKKLPDASAPDAAEVLARVIETRAALMDGDLAAARTALEARREDERVALADAALSLGLGEAERAKRRLEQALEQRPRGVGEHYTAALVYAADGDVENAVHALVAVSRSHATHAVARYQLAHLLAALGDPARAGTLFEAAMDLAPAFPPPALALAKMLANSRQYGEALKILEDLTAAAPEKISPRLMHLRILMEMGQPDAAVDAAQDLLDRAPLDPEVQLAWAEAMILGGHGAQTRETLQELLQQGGQVDRTRLCQLLARAELAATPPGISRAIGWMEQAVQADPESAELLLELGEIHVKAGLKPDALPWLEKLTNHDSADFSMLLYGAVMCRDHQMWRMARRLAEAARQRVTGTAVEPQIVAFLGSLPGGD